MERLLGPIVISGTVAALDPVPYLQFLAVGKFALSGACVLLPYNEVTENVTQGLALLCQALRWWCIHAGVGLSMV